MQRLREDTTASDVGYDGKVLSMTTRTCQQCGNPLPEKAKFCGQCGTVNGEPRAAQTGARTLLSIPQGTPAAAPAPVPIGKRTIVGLPSLAAETPPAPITTVVAPTATAPSAASVTAAAPAAPQGGLALRGKTMLGVAMPGIAPLRAGDPVTAGTPAPPPAAPTPRPATASVRPAAPKSFGETLPIPAFFVPPPAPLEDAPVPSRPRLPRPRGAPLAVAALLAGAVALVGGAVIALLWRSAPPLGAQPRIAPDGKDVLHLTCEPRSCQDGTVVSIGSIKSTFTAGETDLPLAAPLHVGDNNLSLAIDRPGMGRDETVKLVVPVAYRVRADVTTMETNHPSITVRVEAPVDTEVRVDDKPVQLDASGMGTYLLDESAVTQGPADESRVVAIEVPYVVVPKGRSPEKGTVSARIAVAPLRVDAPSASSVIEDDKVLVAGRAAKGASVTVDGASVAVSSDGAFESTVPVGALGDRDIEVRAGTAALAPRTVRVTVKRVASLAIAAKAFEEQQPIGYDAAMRDISAAKTGEAIVVEGEVVEARASGHRTLVLVDDRRGCAKGPCLTRVVVGRDLALAHGDVVRAYGRVARAYRTPTAQTVPEVEAEFVVRPRR